MTKRKICIVVASRANYGRIKAVLRALKACPDVELQIVASASALLYRFGKVVDVMVADGFPPDIRVHVVLEGDSPGTMAKSTGIAITELSTIFELMKPDIVLTVADRYETLATAVAASYMNIHVAHTQGGEVTGSIDESVRHAITKLSHFHFVTTERSRERVLQMGESPDSVFVTGCPSIDAITDLEFHLTKSSLWGGVGVPIDPEKPFLLAIQHPVTTECTNAVEQVRATISALSRIALPTIWLWPNADTGSDAIAKELRVLREHNSPNWLHLHINFPVEVYAQVMKLCSCIIGNSSSALREGAFLGVPAVNIGSRQNDRERGPNVIDVGYDAEAIEAAIRAQIAHGSYPSSHLYGDGHASERIANLLATVPLGTAQKRFYDFSADRAVQNATAAN